MEGGGVSGMLHHITLCPLGMGPRAAAEAPHGRDSLRSFQGPALCLIGMVGTKQFLLPLGLFRKAFQKSIDTFLKKNLSFWLHKA